MPAWFGSLAFRLGVLLALVCAAVVGLAWRTLDANHRVTRVAERVAEDITILTDRVLVFRDLVGEIRYHVVQVWQWFTDLAATRGRDGLDDGATKALAHARELETRLAEARRVAAVLGDSDLVARVDAVAAEVPAFVEAGRRLADAYVTGGTRAGNAFMPVFDARAERMTAALEALLEASERLVTVTTGRVRSEVRGLGTTVAHMEVATTWLVPPAVALLLVLVLYAGLGIALPLRRLAGAAADPAVPSSAFPALRRREEIGRLPHTRAASRDRLARAAAERSRALDDLAGELERRLGDAVRGFEELVGEMRARTAEVAATAEATGRDGGEVVDSVDRTRRLVRTVADDTECLVTAVSDIGRDLDRAAVATREAAASGRGTRRTLDRLAEIARGIDEVTTAIADIAERTHLLALNATIEAARAGEAGRGFTVVAGEVKDLAWRTTEATRHIADRIAEVRSACDEAVATVGDIVERVGEIERAATAAAAAMDRQRATARSIGDRVGTAADEVERIGSRILTYVEETTRNRERAAEVDALAGRLVERAAGLRRALVGLVRKAVASIADTEATGGISASLRRETAGADTPPSAAAGPARVLSRRQW